MKKREKRFVQHHPEITIVIYRHNRVLTDYKTRLRDPHIFGTAEDCVFRLGGASVWNGEMIIKPHHATLFHTQQSLWIESDEDIMINNVYCIGGNRWDIEEGDVFYFDRADATKFSVRVEKITREIEEEEGEEEEGVGEAEEEGNVEVVLCISSSSGYEDDFDYETEKEVEEEDV